jgi:MFS family permease
MTATPAAASARNGRGRASGLDTGGFLLGGITGPALGGIVAALLAVMTPEAPRDRGTSP